MIYTPLTKAAMLIACDKHAGQKDRSGFPFVLHPVHVAESMTDEVTVAAALLHDVLEDTSTTCKELRQNGISEEVIELVLLLTKNEGEDYFVYIQRILQNPRAVKIKLADLEHNMNLDRLNEVTKKDLERMKKYQKAKELLQGEKK
ncbi:MAG TPA: HD domain-containing protein [Lachnospiraceae bacterium]|nr:HD domain-containing protein [Lachnospiraceae bacterium]HPF30043.1 HD domain-containing protein [Lachnospiraceae bacterium]